MSGDVGCYSPHGEEPAGETKPGEDPERFCSRCYAGVDSPEHHEKCVQPGKAELGESAPRTLLGWTVPDHITFTIDEGSYVHITCRWALEDDCSTTTAKGNLAWIGQFLQAHAHGQVVEHREDFKIGQRVELKQWAAGVVVSVDPLRVRSEYTDNLTANPAEIREVDPDSICEPAPTAEAKLAKTQALYNAAIRVMVAHLGCVKEISAERDQLQARIDKALALCEPHPLRHLDTQQSIARLLRGEDEQPTATPPDRSGRWHGEQLAPFGPHDLDGWQPTHPEAVAGD